MKTKTEETMLDQVMMQPETREFSKAEYSHLREKATAANVAVAEYNKFLAFLREQHDIADGDDSWQLTERGFVRQAGSPLGAVPALNNIGAPGADLNGYVKEEV